MVLPIQLGLLPRDVVSFVAELLACLSAGKPPVDSDPITVHSPAPGSGFPPQVAERRDSSRTQALPGEEADFDLCLIEPASVCRRVVDGEPVPQPASRLLAEPLHHRLAGVRTQIVHDQMGRVGPRIVFRNLQQIVGKLGRGAVRSRSAKVPSRLRLHPAKRVGRAASLVLAIAPGDPSGTHGPRRAGDQHAALPVSHRYSPRVPFLTMAFHTGRARLPRRAAAGIPGTSESEGVMSRIRPKNPRLRLDPESYEQLCREVWQRDEWRVPSMRPNVEP